MALATRTNTIVGGPTLGTPTTTATLRASTDTTTSYVASSELDCRGFTTLALEFSLVHNDGTSYEWYYQWGPDDSAWYQATTATVSGANRTLALEINALTIGATGTWHDAIPVEGAYFRLYLKRTGGTGANKVSVTATLLR